MNDFNKRLIHLHSCRETTWKLLSNILIDDNSLQTIYRYSQTQLEQSFQLPKTKARNLYYDLHQFTPEQVISYYSNRNIHPITIVDPTYPSLLKEIYDPPFVLYTMGRQSMLSSNKCIAIIGTRKPTRLGLRNVAHLVPSLVNHNWTIVSGMARGIDTSVHNVAIANKGQTIAVLGSGFDFIYPKENRDLFTLMSKQQLILSEYPPYVPPRKWQFPARNRIISGLSTATLVVEAKEKSGSLITADQALEQGRDVFAVPGSIHSAQSIGTNKLIQQGAKLVITAEDIINE